MEKQAWSCSPARSGANCARARRSPVRRAAPGRRDRGALLGEPRVIVLDEPTSALGTRQTAQFLTLLERLRERGHGVVVTSHSLVDMHAVADRIVVLRLGRVNGEFDAALATQEELLAAVTGVGAPRRGEERGGGAR